MPEGKETKDVVQLWCFDLTNLSRTSQFIILTALTFAFYLVYGYMQVNKTITEPYFKNPYEITNI